VLHQDAQNLCIKSMSYTQAFSTLVGCAQKPVLVAQEKAEPCLQIHVPSQRWGLQPRNLRLCKSNSFLCRQADFC